MMGAAIQVELARPWALLGLLGVLVLAYFFARSLVDLPRRQQAVSLGVRAVLLALLVLAVARPALVRATRDPYLVFVADRSASIGPEARAHLARYLTAAAQYSGNCRLAYLDFAAEPGSVRTTPLAPAPPAAQPASAPAPEALGTNIAAALAVAAASVPPGYVPHVLLLTDGIETEGDALRTALNLSACPVSTAPLPAPAAPEVQLAAVRVPPEVRQGEPFYVDVVVDSNHAEEALLEVFRGPRKVAGQRVKLEPGENAFRFRQTVETERLAEFTAYVHPAQDTLLDNNRDLGLV